MFQNMNMNKLTQNMFRRADGVMWDMMTGKIGIVTDEGIATLEGVGDDAVVNINMIDEFGIAIPAYAQSTQQADVKVGDIIITGKDKIAWVIECKDNGTGGLKYKTMKPSGDTGSWTPPKKTMLGFDTGVMVLRPLINMVSGGATGLQGMQQMMMMMSMFSDDGEIGTGMMDKLMPMMLMGGNMFGGATDASGQQNPMQQMMMMQMMMKMLDKQPSNSGFKGQSGQSSQSAFSRK